MIKFRLGFYIACVILIISSCSRNRNTQTVTEQDIQKYNEKSIEINREIVKIMQDSIKNFVQKNQWSMQKTGSGLWYVIDRSGKKDTIQTGDIVEIKFTVSLLDGTLCYSSDTLGPKAFKVGQGGVESGLEEAILMLCTGDSARLVIPPHLAHGLIGDQNKIPKLAALNYTVVVTKHQKVN